MLDAAMLLLDSGDVGALTTNAVAAKAGVSIGTLYQYFGDKQALLEALMARELGAMAGKIMEAMSGEAPPAPGDRVRLVVRAVAGSYGGRDRVHRLLMAHALTRAPGQRLSPLYAKLMDLFTSDGVTGPDQIARTMSPAQAFVLTHAMAGVLRTLAASDETPPLQEVEDALVRLVTAFMAAP